MICYLVTGNVTAAGTHDLDDDGICKGCGGSFVQVGVE